MAAAGGAAGKWVPYANDKPSAGHHMPRAEGDALLVAERRRYSTKPTLQTMLSKEPKSGLLRQHCNTVLLAYMNCHHPDRTHNPALDNLLDFFKDDRQCEAVVHHVAKHMLTCYMQNKPLFSARLLICRLESWPALLGLAPRFVFDHWMQLRDLEPACAQLTAYLQGPVDLGTTWMETPRIPGVHVLRNVCLAAILQQTPEGDDGYRTEFTFVPKVSDKTLQRFLRETYSSNLYDAGLANAGQHGDHSSNGLPRIRQIEVPRDDGTSRWFHQVIDGPTTSESPPYVHKTLAQEVKLFCPVPSPVKDTDQLEMTAANQAILAARRARYNMDAPKLSSQAVHFGARHTPMQRRALEAVDPDEMARKLIAAEAAAAAGKGQAGGVSMKRRRSGRDSPD